MTLWRLKPDGTLSVAHADVAMITIRREFETALGAEHFAAWAQACRVGELRVRDWPGEWTVTGVMRTADHAVIVNALRTFDAEERPR